MKLGHLGNCVFGHTSPASSQLRGQSVPPAAISRPPAQPAMTLCDLPVDLLHKILVLVGPVTTAHVAMVLSILVRARIDGRRLVDAVAVSIICTFSDELSCEYDTRWPWLYHAVRLTGLLPNKPHPVWLLNSTAEVPRVPPSWFLRVVFCQQAMEFDGFPIDVAALRKMYAVYGMPYTNAAHSQPAWLRFPSDHRRHPISSSSDSGWIPELAESPLARFLRDLERVLHMLYCWMSGQDSCRHVSPAVLDAALSSWAQPRGCPALALDLEEEYGSDEEFGSEDGDYEPEAESDEEMEEESYPVSEDDESEDDESEHVFKRIPGWGQRDLLCRLAHAHGADPTCCHGPCRCTLIGPLSCDDRVLVWERVTATGRYLGRYWDDDLRLARFLAHPTHEKLRYHLDDGEDLGRW